MSERIELSPAEQRVLGCLIEKQLSTPAYYPMTLNSLISACNQRSNRDPVIELTESEVDEALTGLMSKSLASRIRVTGSRVDKYSHGAYDTLDITPREAAIVAELMLRGPQTPGELNSRASRMTEFEGLEEVDITLGSLMEATLVERLERQPGQKERRYAHRLGRGVVPHEHTPPPVRDDSAAGDVEARLSALEAEVARLRAEIDSLGTDR